MNVPGFNPESLSIANELLSDYYDFTRCVRPDGSAYGTGGRCRKGTEQGSFEGDGGIPTDNSGGVIGGSLFNKKGKEKRATQVKSKGKQGALGPELNERLSNLNKGNPFKGKTRAYSLIESVEKLIKREQELAQKGIVDNAFKGEYGTIERALKLISKKYGIHTTYLLSQLDSLPK